MLDALDKEIAPLGIAGYKRPVGGYFISVDVMPGCAKRTLALCKDCLLYTSLGLAAPGIAGKKLKRVGPDGQGRPAHGQKAV